jgi:hypothetical protein
MKQELSDEFIDFDPRWLNVLNMVKERFGKKPDLQAILFLIGIQELAQNRTRFTKEEKQDLMHIAVCHLLSFESFYRYIGKDEDGWPHYEPTDILPRMSRKEQEVLLKKNIIRYFEKL